MAYICAVMTAFKAALVRFPTIFTSVLSFKVLDQLENLTPAWKCVKAQLPSVPCLNNLERIAFVCLPTKDLLHRPRLD